MNEITILRIENKVIQKKTNSNWIIKLYIVLKSAFSICFLKVQYSSSLPQLQKTFNVAFNVYLEFLFCAQPKIV